MSQKKTIGIVAGLNRRAAMEVKTELLSLGDDDLSIVMTEDNFKIDPDPVFAVSDRKIFIFNEAELLAEMGVDLILVPDFKCGSYIHEIQREIQTPILDMKEALMSQMGEKVPAMGVLDAANAAGCASGACDLSKQMKMIFASEEDQKTLDELREKIRAEGPSDEAVQELSQICRRLMEKGAEVIVPQLHAVCFEYSRVTKARLAGHGRF